jgi:hypothetical protein
MDFIRGYDALKKMRAMRHDENSFFIMHHQTWNERRHESDGMRIVRKCRLRNAMPKESLTPDPDLFLPYKDIEKRGNQNRMCRKRLIRYVAFPPKYILIKVDWFKLKPDGKIQNLTNE